MRIGHSVMFLLASAAMAHAQIMDFSPPTPLIGALLGNETGALKKMLAAGANPNEGIFLGSTPLILALMQRNGASARALIAAGADVRATDGAGSTTLMWAAAGEMADVSLVKELLKRGVDPNAVNKRGETALQRAMRRGYTPVVEALLEHGASQKSMLDHAVQRSVALLQKSGAEFIKVSGCTSCHHQSVPQMLNQVARERGFPVDEALADKQRKAVLAMFQPYREQMRQGKPTIPDPSISVTYSLIGIAAEGHAPDETTEAAAHLVALQQREDGSFRSFAARPPIESSEITATALSLRTLQLYGSEADNAKERTARALAWLRTAKPVNNEERSFQLLGLVWGRAPQADIRKAAEALMALQHPDGGWSQLPDTETDAYATGQAMVALHSSHQVTPTSRVYRAGTAYLLRTQLADGSWLVRTRSFPFQKLKESGFPHGRDQWISATATGWAAMALALNAPSSASQSGTQQLSRVF